MPEIRRDPISGQLVIIAAERSRRPEALAGAVGPGRCGSLPSYVENCPFCAGNERMTPRELLALGRGTAAADAAGWRVRVVPNKYPAVVPQQERERDFRAASQPACGAHEVIIESPEHNRHPGSLPPRQMELVLEAYWRRERALAQKRCLRYVQIFRNYRREAGASIEHPHSQLIALPFVPPAVRLEMESAHRAYLEEGSCPFCRMLEETNACGERVVLNGGAYTALIPYAARSPFETWILPRRHEASFFETAAAGRAELALFLGKLFRMLARALGDYPYNYYLHTAPLRSAPLPHYHWHLELIPRAGVEGGFEMSSGIYINTMRPEEAAAYLREKGRSEDESWREDLFHPGPAQSPACGQPG